MSGLRKTNETEPLDKDDGAETDDDAEALSEDNRVDQDRRVESTGTFEGPHFSRISETGRDQEVDDEEEVMTKEEGVGESQGDRPPQSTENPEHERNIKIAMHHESMDDAESAEGTEGNKTPGSREPADISVELGLARRNPKTEATMTEKFLARFPHRRVPSNLSLERILKVCSKLDYIMVKIKLVNYLEHRLYESGTQDSAIPVTTGLNDPHGIFDNIGKIKKHTKHGKIHVTYNRIMFFDSVQAENQRTPGASLAQTLDRLASEKATGVTKELKEELILEYKEEYHKGRRWTDVTKWFGGLGIAIVFIIAGRNYGPFSLSKSIQSSDNLLGIGGHAVSKEWNEVDRNFLEFLSPYLIKIKDIVQALGEDSLDEYCREGHLPEERIRMIQAVGVTMDDDRMTEASDEEAD